MLSASATLEMSSFPDGVGTSALVTQCLDFCQALANMGQTITFSLSIGPNFNISLNTKKEVAILDSRKAETPKTIVKEVRKLTPSAKRRNQKRKEEFLKRKSELLVAASDSESPGVKLPEEKDSFKCDHCENVFHSENGLKIHKGKIHKSSTLPQPERIRDSAESAKPLEVSPLKEVREKSCDDSDSGMEKNHEKQGKSKVSLNPEERVMFGHLLKMHSTLMAPKS